MRQQQPFEMIISKANGCWPSELVTYFQIWISEQHSRGTKEQSCCRSAHGFADTDMQTILGQLRREEEDLCGHRGLLPGTDQQTFQMAVPLQLRSYYRKVMAPISSVCGLGVQPAWGTQINQNCGGKIRSWRTLARPKQRLHNIKLAVKKERIGPSLS